MRPFRRRIGPAGDESPSHFPLQREIPSLQIRISHVGLIDKGDMRQHKGYVGRRICAGGKWIGRTRIRIGESVGGVSVDRDQSTEGSLVGLTVGRNRVGAIVEDTVAAAQAGLTVSEYIPSETKARPEVVPRRVVTPVRQAGIARVKNSDRGIDVSRRLLTRSPR